MRIAILALIVFISGWIGGEALANGNNWLFTATLIIAVSVLVGQILYIIKNPKP